MKIALIGLRLTVGPRLISDTLGPALVRRGHDVVFVGENHRLPPELRGIITNDGSSYSAMLGQSVSPDYHRLVVDAIRRERPDLCYFLAVHPANGLLARMIRSQVSVNGGHPPAIAVHLHDPVPHPGGAWPLIFAAQQLAARSADHVVVYGRALARQVVRLYGVSPELVVVVPHGASRPPRTDPPSSATPPDRFSFLGRIAGYKGIGVFLAAARRLLARHGHARFCIAGTGSLRRYGAGIRALGSSLTVINRELSNDETDRIMQNSWAVVLPYTSGTQSGVIPVAYWNGCPVVTTAVGSLPELVRDRETGFVVRPRDPAAIAARMAQLMDNQALRQELGAGAFAFYERKLRWDVIAGDLLNALEGRRVEEHQAIDARDEVPVTQS